MILDKVFPVSFVSSILDRYIQKKKSKIIPWCANVLGGMTSMTSDPGVTDHTYITCILLALYTVISSIWLKLREVESTDQKINLSTKKISNFTCFLHKHTHIYTHSHKHKIRNHALAITYKNIKYAIIHFP